MLGTITITVGQGESSGVVQKEEASENMEVVKQELPAEDTKVEKDKKNGLDSIAEAPTEEQSEQQLSKEPPSNELGFKKVFKFVGLKFTVKKEKSEKSDAVQLLTVKKDVECNERETEVAKSDTPEEFKSDAPEEFKSDTPEEIKLATPEEVKIDTPEEIKLATPEEVKTDTPEEIKLATPEEAELGSPAEVLEDLPVEQREEETVIEVPLEKTGESTAKQEVPAMDTEGEKEDVKSGEPVKSPDSSETSSPFKKFTSALFSGLKKRTSFKKSKEEQPAENSGKEEKEHAGVPLEASYVEVPESQEPSVEEPVLLETVESAEGYEVVMKGKTSEEIMVDVTAELRETGDEIVEKMEIAIQSDICEEKADHMTEAEQVITPDAEQTASLQEVDKQVELIEESTEEVQSEVEPRLTESGTEVTSSSKPAEAVSNEVEQLSLQEKNKVQGSPLKKLFTGTGLKKLSGKRQKGKKEETKTEEGAEQLHPSAEPLETAEAQKESSPSSEEETAVAFTQEQTAVDAAQSSDDVEGDGALSDGEKKKEGITPWASFKKMVTPKKRVKRPSESDKEDELTDKAKSATVSSTESAASSEKQEYVKGDVEEQKLEKSNEEPKKKVDSSVSWEALICVGSSKRRARKSSDSDDEVQKTGEETQKPVDETGKLTEEETPVTSQEADQEQGNEFSDNAGSPSDGEGVSTWESFKRLVTPRRKSKTKTEDKQEEPAASTVDTVTSDGELGKEESWVSFKKLIPGRKKRKSDGKQEQAHTEEYGKDAAEAVDDDSETPAVVPLSEYDAAVQEKVELLEPAVVANEVVKVKTEIKANEDAFMSPDVAECSVGKFHSVTAEVVEVKNSGTDVEERSPSWISVTGKEPVSQELECGSKKITEHVLGTIKVVTQEMHVAAMEVKQVAHDTGATFTEEIVELTSEAVTALEEAAEKSVAEETTEMISAVSQLSESAATSGEATPVPDAEEKTQNMQELSKQAQEVLQSLEKVQLTEILSSAELVTKGFESVQKMESEVHIKHIETTVSTVQEPMYMDETLMKGIPETLSALEYATEQTTEIINDDIIVSKETIKDVKTDVLAAMHTKLEDLQHTDLITEKVHDTIPKDTEVKKHSVKGELQEKKLHEPETEDVAAVTEKQTEGTAFEQTEGLADEEPKAAITVTEMLVTKSEETVLLEEFSSTREVSQKVMCEVNEVLQGGPLQYESAAVEGTAEKELVKLRDSVMEQLVEKKVAIEEADIAVEERVHREYIQGERMGEISEPELLLSKSGVVVSDEMHKKNFGDEGMKDISKSDKDEMLKYEEQDCKLTGVQETLLKDDLAPVTEVPTVEISEAREASIPLTTVTGEEPILAETVKVTESQVDRFAVAELPSYECSAVIANQTEYASYEIISSETVACPVSFDECAHTAESLSGDISVTQTQSEPSAISKDVTEPASTVIVKSIAMAEACPESFSISGFQAEPGDTTECSLSESLDQPVVICGVHSEPTSISESSNEVCPVSECLSPTVFTQVLTESAAFSGSATELSTYLESLDEQSTTIQSPAESSAVTAPSALMADVLDSSAEPLVTSEVLPEPSPITEFLTESSAISEVTDKAPETIEAITKTIVDSKTSAESIVVAEAVVKPAGIVETVTDLAVVTEAPADSTCVTDDATDPAFVTEAMAEHSLAMEAVAESAVATESTSECCVSETLVDTTDVTENLALIVSVPEAQTEKLACSETSATPEEVGAGHMRSVISDSVSEEKNKEAEIQSVAQTAAAIVDAAIEAATISLSDHVIHENIKGGSGVKEYENKNEEVAVVKETSSLVQTSLEMQMQETIIRQSVVREMYTVAVDETAGNASNEMVETVESSVSCLSSDSRVEELAQELETSPVTLRTEIMQIVQEHTDEDEGQNAVKDEQMSGMLHARLAEYVPEGEMVAAEVVDKISETSREESCEELVQGIRKAVEVTVIQATVQPQTSTEPLQESIAVLHGTGKGAKSDPEQADRDPPKKTEANTLDAMVSLEQSARQDGDQINSENAIAVEGPLLTELVKTDGEQCVVWQTDGQILMTLQDQVLQEVHTECTEYSQKQVSSDETLQVTSEQTAS